MSWLYSQALVEEYLGANCSDGEPFAQLNVMPTQHKFWRNDKMMEFSRLSQFGLTLRLLTESLGEELLTLFLAGFHAKILARQVEGPELMGKEAECGEKWSGSFTKYSQDLRSWKTRQCSLLGGLEQFLETWPEWGLMQDGECWELTLQGLTIGETGFGLLPTVLATDWKGGTTAIRPDNGKLRFDQWRHYVKLKHGLTYPHPTHSEIRMGWPLGWTDLKPLATDKFQEWQQQHGGY
jgi:hypothetical protein